MLVIIGIARTDYQQLLHNVPPQAPASNVLRRCPELYRWGREEPLFKCVILECNPCEATLVLEAAKQHCPEAVPDIEYGIKLSREFRCVQLKLACSRNINSFPIRSRQLKTVSIGGNHE